MSMRLQDAHLYEAHRQRDNVINVQGRRGTHDNGLHFGRYVHGWQVPPTSCAELEDGHSCSGRRIHTGQRGSGLQQRWQAVGLK
jgi:hypothetical protein